MESNTPGKRIGIMGGSFDPVHSGHLIIAQDAVEKLDLSEVVFIPASIPPHKRHLRQVSVEHRSNMMKLAVESDLRFSVSDLELSRGGISYTFDTIREFRNAYPGAELFMIVGSDTLVDLHNWHRIEVLLELCEVASFIRPGEDDLDAIAEKIKLGGEQKDRLLRNVFGAHLIGVSSTEIRRRVAEGLSVRYLTPPEVEMYIFEHGLYQG